MKGIKLMITQEDAQNKVARRKSHDRGQIDRHSTRCPKIKQACAKRLQEEALSIARGRGQRTDIT